MVDKPHNSGQWSVARFHAFIKGALRQASMKWPPKHEVRKAARVARAVYQCTGYGCETHETPASVYGEDGKRINNIYIDHIEPVVDPHWGFIGWDDLIKRMFCEQEGLQLLCLSCHKKKTADERKKR